MTGPRITPSAVVVRHGIVRDTDGRGIDLQGVTHAVAEDVVVIDAGSNGISLSNGGGVVEDCLASENGLGGIFSGGRSVISGWTARQNTGVGISSGGGSVVTECASSDNTGDGFSAGGRRTSPGARRRSTGGPASRERPQTSSRTTPWNQTTGANIHVAGLGNRIDGNHLVAGTVGIDADVAGNTVVRNSARGVTDPYGQIVGDNDAGPIGTAAASTIPWANISNGPSGKNRTPRRIRIDSPRRIPPRSEGCAVERPRRRLFERAGRSASPPPKMGRSG